MATTQRLAEQWAQRSPREQVLAVAVACLAATMVVLLLVRSAWGTLDGLDRDIDRMTTDLLNYHYQVARRKSVDARFTVVATQHSSAWSESEIRDRLRQEIYRLANRIPPGLDENGIPLSTNSDGGALVSIPQLGEGRLKEGGEGFREYQISVRIPGTPIDNMFAYLERLQGSPQSLRLDRIDLRRDPARNEVSADLDITRIVVDTAGANSESDAGGLPEESRVVPLVAGDWQLDGATATMAGDLLLLQSESANARAWLPRSLPAGATYDVRLQAEALGTVTANVAVDGVDLAGDGPVSLESMAGPREIIIRFTVPETGQGRVPIELPSLRLAATGDTLRVMGLEMTPVNVP